jgi:flagellar hook-associated protein 3 FlgL
VRIIFDPIRDGLGAIETASSHLARAQHQLSTGKRVTAAGDDPLAVQQAIGERATIGAVDAYSRANQAAASRLAAVDNVLTGMSDKLTAVTVAGLSARGSAVDATARMAAAERVRSLRDALLTDVNTSFQGTYLFSGTNVDRPPYVQSGGFWTYQGNNSVTRVEVDRGRLVSVTFDGQQIIQGADASDLFTVLDDLATAIEAGDSAAIGTGLDAVERAFTRTQRAIGALGADEQGLDDAAIRLSSLRQAAETRRSSLEDVNMAEAATRMSQADTAYRAALAAVSAAERQSLLDYLR